MNRYYIVAMNSKTRSYITGEFRLNGVINGLEDLKVALEILLKEFNEEDDKYWFILNWKLFEEEE